MAELKRPESFLYRVPIAVRVAVLAIVSALAIGAYVDYSSSLTVGNAFRGYVEEVMVERAQAYRFNFTRILNSHSQLARVMVMHRNMVDYLRSGALTRQKPGTVRHDLSPDWMPGNTLLRAFNAPAIYILLDRDGTAREIYTTRTLDIPADLAQPGARLLALADQENHLTLFDDRPFIISSDHVHTESGKLLAMLLVASPLDSDFLNKPEGLGDKGLMVAIIDPALNVMVTSDSARLPVGSVLSALGDRFIVLTQEFLEYGGSELNFRFATIVDAEAIRSRIDPVIMRNRTINGLAAGAFVLLFSVVLILSTRRVKRLTDHINAFSREKLKGQHLEAGRWDELYILQERFRILTGEVVAAAETIREEEAQRTRSEEELRGKERQIDLLLAVTEATGIGVAIERNLDVIPINSKMEYYCSMYGEPDCFAIAEGREREMDVQYRDGSIHTFQVISPKTGMDEKIILALDITERKQSIEKIIQGRKDWESTFDSISDMITIVDREFKIVAANAAARETLGIKEGADGINLLPSLASSPHDSHDCLSSGKSSVTELYEPRLNKYVEVRMIPRIDARGSISGIIHVVRDITERKRLENDLRTQALYDSLTGLPNRMLFADRLQNLFDHRRRIKNLNFSVMFLDIDHFKKINDSLGHVIGDELLVNVSQRLLECVRPGDTVSRFGGDEFVMLLDSTSSEEDAVGIAERIHEQMSRPFHLTSGEVFLSASIGIALGHDDYLRPDEVIRDADTAMYHAKARGRACYIVFDDQMHFKAVESLNLEGDMRRAIERREFTLHYQPIVDVTASAVRGFEALVRWEHPVRGLLMPDQFISMAEETGLILPIGELVLEMASRQIAQWNSIYSPAEPYYVSVNISPRQLYQNLPDMVAAKIMENDLPIEALRLEITESLLMENPEIARTIIHRLKKMNVQVYLDDFGTGYSSLSYLHRFPVDALKIDRTFVRNSHRDAEALEIVRAISGLAANLGINVIVEGVERKDQLETYMALGCRNIQGYYFAPPMPVQEAERYIDAHIESGLLIRQ